MVVSITKLKEQLEEYIDIDDFQEVEKVERYIDLVKTFRKIKNKVNKDGPSVTVINASQEYTKSHPLLADMARINTSLLALEKSIFGVKTTSENGNNNSKKNYDSDDLL